MKQPPDPMAHEIARKLQSLIGQRLLDIKVVPLGVMFEFERAVYWAYGGPITEPRTGGAKWQLADRLERRRT